MVRLRSPAPKSTTPWTSYGRFPEWPKGAACKSVVRRLRWSESTISHQQKTHFCLPTKVRFLNDVCLWQMMLATPVMTASPNDVCLRAHRGKHRIIATNGSNIILSEAKNIISPQAWHIIECITRLRRDIHSYIIKGALRPCISSAPLGLYIITL